MLRWSDLFLACALAAPLAAVAAGAASAAKAAPVRMKGGEVELTARVVEIDHGRRSVTLRSGRSSAVTLEVPADVKGFDKLRVGDTVQVRYLTAIAIRLQPMVDATAEPSPAALAAPVSVPAGGLPAAAPHTTEAVARIISLDPKTGTAALRVARRNVTVAVPQRIDVSKLKAGEQVRVSIIEASLISVAPVPAGK